MVQGPPPQRPPARSFAHGLGRALAMGLAGLALLLGAALFVLAIWLQSEGSLEQGLRLAQRLLPAGQSLQAESVRGSLAGGGSAGSLRWSDGALTVQAQAVELDWDWRALLDGELRATRLHMGDLRIEDRGPSSKGWSELVLPLRADVAFAVDRLEWAGPPALQLEQLGGHYRYDGSTHVLDDARVQMAAGSYTGQARLQARAPMALDLRVQGRVQTGVALRQLPLELVASGTASGRLLGPDARLDADLSLLPADQGRGRPLAAMQARVQARLVPGRAQPIEQAQVHWSALDLASIWPKAPQTRLSGQASVLPASAGWKGELEVDNGLAGPLDHQRLPLRSAQASVLYRDGRWQVSRLQAALAGGSLQAQGSYGGNPAQWAVRGTLQGIEPGQLDTRWQWAPVSGSWTAQPSGHGVDFEADVASRLGTGSVARDARLQAHGSWQAPLLQLDSLELRLPQARLAGTLQVDTQTWASEGRLQAELPGAQATLEGKAGPVAGQGSSRWQVADARALQQWLAGLPRIGTALGSPALDGAATLDARWSGGWQHHGEALQLQASLQSPRLDVQPRMRLRALRLDLSGRLQALALQVAGKAEVGVTQWALQAGAQGGQVAEHRWQGQLQTLQLTATGIGQAVPWTVQLQQPVALDWTGGTPGASIALAEGSLRLAGPAPGTAQLRWQPVQWSDHPAAGGSGGAHWSSKGQLQGVPLAWLELLGQTRLANLGLRGDLLFGGHWDASHTSAGLHVRASLQRSSGDLQLLGAGQSSAPLPAGLRDAHVDLDVENDVLRASLVWDSAAAGQAQATFSTRLRDGAWPEDAPLQGTLHASLPRVGVWSLVAPVGWRIQGTLEADATLSGSRRQPDWKGSLSASDMSVRSVLDGIDFNQGVLRVQIDGQHLDITEWTLQGGGPAGGRLQITGSADWLPAVPGSPLASHVRMALDARAQAFRISARPDQRLVVSGNLNARLNDARLQVRGALVADQALVLLPDDTAPRLGSDVVVERPRAAASAPAATGPSPLVPAPAGTPAPAPANRLAVVPDISVSLDPGTNFQLQGHGIQTRLAGKLTLNAQGQSATPRLNGELHTVNGTYRAYGQRLNIESGTLRFAGPYDNPSLDILALRPNLQQVVGVQVSGTAQLPVVRLYSEPDMPDADKLSWLVLGRASSNGGAETAMLQQAALALLAGNGKTPVNGLVNAFGLDELSLGQTATANQDGTSGTETTVRLGKRLSRDFYVSFERGLAGTLGTLYVFYDLSRRLTLRAESGTQSAVDLIFTTKFD